MATNLSTPLMGVSLTETPTSQVFKLGTRVMTFDGQEYVYVQASGAIAQYAFVGIDENFQAASLTKTIADDGWMIGVAQVAFTDDDYGWIAVRGANLTGAVLGSCTADVALYTSATAGYLDDSSTSQTKIDGIVAVSAVGTATAASTEVLMTFPKSTTF